MGGLSAISVPNGEFITYSRGTDSYEMLLTNFLDDSGQAYLDFYVEAGDAVEVAAIHPRDGLISNGADWEDREEDFGDFIHITIGDSTDGPGGPFGVLTFPREVAARMAEEVTNILKITEKEV